MEEKHYLSNRQRSMEPRGKGFWCLKCDRCAVWAGRTCPVCGFKNGKHRAKP